MTIKVLKTYRREQPGQTPFKVMTRVYFDDYLEEYTVGLFVDGKKQKGATYFTDDKDDALQTAQYMRNHLDEIVEGVGRS